MGNLLVEDENVKSSKSSFAIYDNEKIKYEGKEITASFFAYKIQSGFFKAIDIEIINAVYILKYSTSRQITSFLNYVKNIDVNQNLITKRLTILNNSSVVGRYSFISDDRLCETSSKCYVLRERGKRLLLQREYPCTWNIYDSVIVLENIKNYLARNNYILKVLKNQLIDYDNLKLFNEGTIIGCNYSINDFKHSIISMRKTDTICQIKKFLLKIDKDFGTLKNQRIIIIGEDDLHLFQIFKQIISLIQKKEIDKKYFNCIIFTQDLRIIERNIDSCFVIWKIEEKAILEDIKLDEFTKSI
ncbi:hypothetical protein DVW12_17335 [Clostridium botulinum]|nr:hypothetical protein [Clostridium botulinum]